MTLVLVVIFAVVCLALTALMPWAELGMPPNGPLAGLHDSVVNAFKSVPQGDQGYYVYAVVLGLALVAASIAINVVGREDAEEKLVLPVKK